MKVDPAGKSGAEIYRWMISTIVPRPIAWVVTRSAAGVDNLAPFSYFNGVTSKPPTISLAIGHRRWRGELVKKDTLRNIEETGEFVVHAATKRRAEAINASSAEAPPDTSEIDALGLTRVPSDLVRPPRIRESPAAFECRLDQVILVGKPPRTGLVLGEIVRFHIDDAVLDESGAVDPRKLDPVARLGGENWADDLRVFRQERPDWKAKGFPRG